MYYEEPFFKRTIMPWYQSNGVSICIIVIMAALMAFSVIGIQVANMFPVWYKLKGMPYALLILSGLGLVIHAGRLIQRRVQKMSRSRKWY